MLVKSVYDTEAEIPDFAKAEFERRADGKYYLKQDAIPGAAELLNPGLEANRARWQQQKEAADGRATSAETRAANAERELATLRTPGAVVLSGDDAKAWNGIVSSGVAAKDVPKLLTTELPELRRKVERSELDATLRLIAEKSHVKLNPDVLSDWLSGERGKGLKVVLKPVEILNDKQEKVTVQMPYIVKSEPVAGQANTFKETETLLTDFAKANLPAYLVIALEQVGDAAGGGQTNADGSTSTGPGGSQQNITGAFRLPDLGGKPPAGTQGAQKGATGAAAIVEAMNAERDTRKNPLVPNAPAPAGGSNAGQG